MFAQLSRLRYHVRKRFRHARVDGCRWVPENYALPGKRGRASGSTIRLRNWYRARKATAFARNTRGSDSFSAVRRGERWESERSVGALERRAMQRWKRYAIRAQIGTYRCQARLFDRISLGGVAGGTIDFYISICTTVSCVRILTRASNWLPRSER